MPWLSLTLTMNFCEVGNSLALLGACRGFRIGEQRNCRNESGQSEAALQALGWISLAEQRAKNKAKIMFEIFHDLAPGRLSTIFIEANATNSNYNLKNSAKNVALPLPKRYIF